MAGTFYKYAERNIETQINWAEVGRTVTDMLNEEVRLREQKKQAIDDATREQLKVIENKPLGEQQGLNEYMMGLGDDLTQTVLMQDRLLKSGQLKLKDYLTTRQNLSDDTNTMFDVAQQLQTTYKDAMDRYKSGQSQETEAWLMQTVQGLAKFTGTKPIVNPATGRIEVTGLVKDGSGQMVPDPNNTFSIRELLNFTKTKLDRFQHGDATTTAVDGLGEEIYSDVKRIEGSYKMYKITQYEDITNRKNLSDDDKNAVAKYFEWEKDTIGEMVENPYNRLSILTNAVRGYEPTWSEEEAAKDPKKVLIRRNDDGSIMPEFSEEQKKVSERFLQTEIRMKLDKKVTTAVTTEPIPTPEPAEVRIDKYNTGKIKTSITTLAGDFALLYNGTPSQRQQAANSIRSKNPNIIQVDYDDIGATFYYRNGTKKSMPFKDMSEGQWASSNVMNAIPEDVGQQALSSGLNVEQTYREGAGGKNWNNTKRGTGTGSVFTEQLATASAVATRKALDSYSEINATTTDEEAADNIILIDSEGVSIEQVDAYIRGMGLPMGYTVAGDGSADPTSDGIIVKNSKGEKVFAINLDKNMNPMEKLNALESLAVAIDGDMRKTLGAQYEKAAYDYKMGGGLFKKPVTTPKSGAFGGGKGR
jgi:hypothetical protein